jgi:hypothetical protein
MAAARCWAHLKRKLKAMKVMVIQWDLSWGSMGKWILTYRTKNGDFVGSFRREDLRTNLL